MPRAKLFVVFPEGNDRLELYHFDIDQALEKSGVDYLLVTSRPPATAKRGAEYTYQVTVKSRKGDVKYLLSYTIASSLSVNESGRTPWTCKRSTIPFHVAT